MVPARTLLARMLTIFGTYVEGQLAAPGWRKHAVKTSFVPGPNLVAADVTIDPDWAQNAVDIPGGMNPGRNPYGGNYMVANNNDDTYDLSTTATVRNVFGFVVSEVGTNVVVASELLPTPAPVAVADALLPFAHLKFELPTAAVR